MPIKTTCPNCAAVYNLADTMRGKQVKCKSCQEAFTVAGVRPANGTARARDDDDYPRRRRPDDDYDDALPRRRGQQKNSKTGLIVGIVVGGLLLIGGGVTAIILLSGGKSDEEKALEALGNIQMPQDLNMPKFPGDMPNLTDFPNPDKLKDLLSEKLKNLAKDSPKGFPRGNPFAGDDSKPQKALTFADHLKNLQTGDDRAKSQAVNFFQNADPSVPERAEVGKALGAHAQKTNGRADVVRALCRWASKDQAPMLVSYVTDTNFANGDRRQAAIAALGELKDERGVEPIINRLGDAFDWTHARKALESYGSAAQTGLVRNRFHKNDNVRNHVKELLKSINAPAELIVPQALKDVASSDREVRHAAVNWLGETPLIEKSQADVARALEPLLSNADGRDAVVKALETWATKDNVPALAGLLSQNVSRQPILRILTKLKDERAADAIAARLPDGGDRPLAAAALKDIGPPAEKAVLAYFHHPDRAVQKVAADLLKGFGTTQDALLEQTLKDVSDAKKGRRRDALEWLATADLVDSKRNDVSKAVEPVLQDQDRGMRDVAYRAYFRWLGPEGLNTLIQIVIAEQSDHRHKAMEALSKYKDLKAAGAIASRLPHGGDRSVASKCLKAMGGWAETPCVQLLGSKDRAVRFEVVHILQVVGTRQCIVYLQGSAKVHAKDQEYLRTVGAAVQAISAR